MATYKAIKDPGVTWSSEPYGTMPPMSTGEVGGYAYAPTDWGFIPQLAAQLGWQPQAGGGGVGGMLQDSSFQADNQQAIDDAVQWLKSQGLTPASGGMGSTYYNGVKDASGNLVGLQGLDSAKTARGDLMGLLGTVGLPALGGALASGALGGAGSAAGGWTSGFDLPMGAPDVTGLLGAQGLDSIPGMSPVYASGAAPAGITSAAIDAAPVTMADMNIAGGLSAAGGLVPGSEMAAALGGAALAPISALKNVAPITSAAIDATPVTQAAMNAAGGIGTGLGLSGLVDALGGAKGVGAALGGLLGAAAGPQSDKSSITKTLDPRMDAMLYGPGGYLQSVQDYFNANKNGNPNLTAGANALQSFYSNPAITAGYQNMMNTGQQMMGGGGSDFLRGLLAAGPQRMPATVPYTNIPAPASSIGTAALPWMKFGG